MLIARWDHPEISLVKASQMSESTFDNLLVPCWPSRRVSNIIYKDYTLETKGFPGGSVVKNLPANAGNVDLIPGSGRFLEKKWQPAPVFLPEKSHGSEDPGGLQSIGLQESDKT